MEEEKLKELLADAEERGYQRGLNARIEEEMKRPGIWEQPPQEELPEEDYQILANPRRTPWDN
ncbi:MAG: hypothetical protein K2K82_03685 [Muribaculaceae bacterium]|nr:hypothetical protein [Muribaculaceae bacterium]